MLKGKKKKNKTVLLVSIPQSDHKHFWYSKPSIVRRHFTRTWPFPSWSDCVIPVNVAVCEMWNPSQFFNTRLWKNYFWLVSLPWVYTKNIQRSTRIRKGNENVGYSLKSSSRVLPFFSVNSNHLESCVCKRLTVTDSRRHTLIKLCLMHFKQVLLAFFWW